MDVRQKYEDPVAGPPPKEVFDYMFSEWLEGKGAFLGDVNEIWEFGEDSKAIYDEFSYMLAYGPEKLERIMREAVRWRKNLLVHDAGIAKKYYKVIPELIMALAPSHFLEAYPPGIVPHHEPSNKRTLLVRAIHRLGSRTESKILKKDSYAAGEFLEELPRYLEVLRKKLVDCPPLLPKVMKELENFLENPSGYS